MKLNICLKTYRTGWKKIWMYLPHERQRSWCIMAYMYVWSFQNKCQLQHALKNMTELFWARTKVQICGDCPERLRALQPFLNTICCSMYSQSHARRAVTQLHGFPIHTVAASRLDICTENPKHLDLKYCSICNAFNSTVFPTWGNQTVQQQWPRCLK